MRSLPEAVADVLSTQTASGQPVSVVLAGHNGSGKSTLWYRQLAPRFQIPLVNADRMMMSILPDVSPGRRLPSWASALRDGDTSWMEVAQKGVEAFVAQAMARKVAFAMETVFSHWRPLDDGSVESKIDLIRQMQAAGYFVVLIFVGLTSAQLSIGRVSTRKQQGGHGVAIDRLISRFPRTQRAIEQARSVADAAILLDNSRTEEEAFTVCRVQIGSQESFDLRRGERPVPPAIRQWLDVVAPL